MQQIHRLTAITTYQLIGPATLRTSGAVVIPGKGNDMAQRTCDVDGCERTHWARGMCATHYGMWHRKIHGRTRNGERFTITCVTCGELHQSARREGKYCSDLCRDYDKWGARTCAWPKPEPRVAKPKPEQFHEQRECAWCGDQFEATRRVHRFCSFTCKKKASKSRRRGQEYGSTSHFTWAEVMRLFVHTFDRCCAYCEQPVEGPPDPDHVVPLSRGGSNSITNILPSCRPCNSDKRDLLVHEWMTDRERRGLPRLPFDLSGRRYVHLTDAHLISPVA